MGQQEKECVGGIPSVSPWGQRLAEAFHFFHQSLQPLPPGGHLWFSVATALHSFTSLTPEAHYPLLSEIDIPMPFFIGTRAITVNETCPKVWPTGSWRGLGQVINT